MQIEILKAGEVRKEGKYFKFELTYSRDGKPSNRTLVAVGDTKPVFEVLKDSKQGEVYEIDLRKDGEYYNWIGCTKGEALAVKGTSPVPAGTTSTSSFKSTNTYETPDERAKKQVYIARMSALAQAVSICDKDEPPEDIIEVAKVFESYIMGYGSVAGIESDKLEDIETK